ncbi:MAG: hypothetical protein EXS17_00170 [Phycisphaerales bacterium]|nr:hypothetical protein [Phycisphaerales bacterium]
MKTATYSMIALTCLTLTSLSIATTGSGRGKGATRATPMPTKIAQAIDGMQAESKAARTLPQLGVSRADLSALGRAGGASPNVTAETIRSLKVGDQMLFATTDGTVLDLVVSRRGWTGADEKQIYFSSGETGNAIYGIISQVGPRLTGYFLARSGVSYALSALPESGYQLTVRPNYGALECGVDRVRPANPNAMGDPIQAQGGLAGGMTPCPPEVIPFEIPAGLRRDGGIIIDVLFVFSVDANDAVVASGSTVYDQAVLTVAQANVALKNSTGQGATTFNGQDADNQLNTQCGYGVYPAPGAAAFTTPPTSPISCGADPINPATVSAHEARAGVTPAESDVCTPRLRLVGALVADGFFGQEEPFVSTGQGVDLTRLENYNDGILDYVQTWRDALGADSVALVGMGYGSDSAFVGLASVMNDANNGAQGIAGLSIPANPHPIVDTAAGALGPSSVSTLQAFSESPYCLLDYTILGDLTYAHELGHNFGCQHDHDAPSAAPQDALFPDSFGFGDDNFRTVMAYAAGGNVRLPGFSNPEKTWADYEGPDNANTAAGLEFDFDCSAISPDGLGTHAQYVPGSGVGPGDCDQEGDDDPSSPAAMVIASDVTIDDAGQECANNARSISQAKFDFARFRCSIFPVADCNNNLIDDFVEALDGTNDDCDSNGIPDDCETAQEDPGIPSPIDCNQNQIPDACDIANGESQDTNANSIPDECEDQSLLFRENFETIALGTHDGALPIAKVSAEALAQIRLTDPDFPDYFATIETSDMNPDPTDTGFIFTDIIPSLFQYGLGRNGNLVLNGALGQGFAIAFGSRGYGQRLSFNSVTGDFPSGNGFTTIVCARSITECRLYINAADFEDHFAANPPLPQLANFGYLEENLVTVQGIDIDDATGAEVVVFQQSFDLRTIETPAVPSGLQFVRIAAAVGDPAIVFDKIAITGAFVAMDNVSFDRGQIFAECIADIAGGIPIGGVPTPDGRVGAEDLLLILAAFDAANPVDPTDPIAVLADVNDDGFVDASDLLEILSSFGNCPGGVAGP